MLTTTFELERDRYGRPMFEGRSWTRPSTLARTLDDQSNLIAWKGREVARAILENRDLLALGDPAEILQASESNDAAAYGTEVHRIASHGLTDGTVHATDDPEAVADARAAVAALKAAGYTPIATELTVVSDEFECLGTTDGLARHESTGVIRVFDFKTAGNADGWKWNRSSYAVQLAVYASGDPILSTGNGPERVAWESLALPAPSDDLGLVIHVHARHAVAKVLEVDLGAGRNLARLALQVRQARKTNTLRVIS